MPSFNDFELVEVGEEEEEEKQPQVVPGSRVRDADGHAWCRVDGPAGSTVLTLPSPSGPPRKGSPPGQGGKEILAGVPVGDVPAIMQLMFQQSKMKLVVPQIQFFDRVVDIPAVCRDWYAQCKTVQQTVEISQVQFLVGCRRARCCATTGAWVAQYLVRPWIHILRQFEHGFMDEFLTFYVKVELWILRSILVSSLLT